MATGRITRIAGPLVEADGMRGVKMYEIVRVGEEHLIGEIIKLDGDVASIQVYEETTGMRPEEPVEPTGQPLSVELGPGILRSLYDGIQRPLEVIKAQSGDFILRGAIAPPIDEKKKWDFRAHVKKGDSIEEGSIIGSVQETDVIEHKIMVPPGISGVVEEIREGEFTVKDTICVLKTEDGKSNELTMLQRWPVKKPRPIKKRLNPEEPLITGQRIIDTFFPVVKGGTAAIPGPFGAGKTVTQHQLAKWADADIVVYVGCGERGNEMTEVLDEFPKLEDPRSGKPLMERTVLIANTSNMPVAARDASVYTGITLAEYYRDMGYNTAVMADSTSRWAEAMREISSRLEEMPGEEGYPAYLSARLAEFYERSGRVVPLGSPDRIGSVSVIGAVSPPGGDFSEPVTQNTLRIVRVFWGLDARLADRRHFPSINWLNSYSLYVDKLGDWFDKNVAEGYGQNREKGMTILQREAELIDIVQLVGAEALPESEKLVLESARMIREDFLQQNAYHEVDTYCSPAKQSAMLSSILGFYDACSIAIKSGVKVEDLSKLEVVGDLAKMRYTDETRFPKEIEKINEKIGEVAK
ncbi:MAG: ATP synthase subunit A [Candidatus Altiarchaeota archaeon]